MASVPDLHDAEIVGLAHDRAAGVLSLSIRPTRGPAASLRFTGVLGWGLSEFCDQNVLFEVRTYTAPPAHLADEVPAAYRDAVQAGTHRCYELDPSTGLGGWVIAAGLDIA
jgi:hypothetical protein